MEIRARYVQMGIFTLAVIVMGFAFIYWLNNAGALREHTIYRVRFEGPVSGLASGSAVLFNGIRVGGVTRLQLNPDDPRQVQATIAVDRGTPVRADTTAGIDFQGLTGSPVIALVGGTSRTRLAAAKGETPLLVADPTASQSMSQAAREVLRRMDGVLAENAQPLRDMIGNINTFSGALARNSDRLDGIVAGLERMTGGATSKARIATYDLTVPRVTESAAKVPTAQLVIPDPTALAALDNDRIQTRAASGASSAMADAQWSDALTKLVQLKLIRTFEDAGLFGGVSRPLDGLTADYQLFVDVRSFQIATAAPPKAEVEMVGKVFDNTGRIIDTRIFRAGVASGPDAPAAAVALDQAFGKVANELAAWTSQTIGDRTQAPAPAKGATPKKPTRG
jgi:phospholipid/cholesterol/gamma-HCH transport system substrate-binding protein